VWSILQEGKIIRLPHHNPRNSSGFGMVDRRPMLKSMASILIKFSGKRRAKAPLRNRFSAPEGGYELFDSGVPVVYSHFGQADRAQVGQGFGSG
jgi:hypothetical protein